MIFFSSVRLNMEIMILHFISKIKEEDCQKKQIILYKLLNLEEILN